MTCPKHASPQIARQCVTARRHTGAFLVVEGAIKHALRVPSSAAGRHRAAIVLSVCLAPLPPPLSCCLSCAASPETTVVPEMRDYCSVQLRGRSH